MEWVAEQGIGGKSRTIVASTDRGLGYDSEDDYSNDDSDSDDMDGDWEYKPVVSKARGSHYFRRKRRLFRFVRNRSKPRTDDWDRGRSGNVIEMTISCVGRTTEPIRELLKHIAGHHYAKSISKTYIKRPAQRKRGKIIDIHGQQ
ncbi:MAG: hypothetical protein LQ340_004113 [Diploschistes diacapsis]|nr:MAG: hypothetical protein LQ340_004113 [Diploschistes diacapsis]